MAEIVQIFSAGGPVFNGRCPKCQKYLMEGRVFPCLWNEETSAPVFDNSEQEDAYIDCPPREEQRKKIEVAFDLMDEGEKLKKDLL